jgi:hypothetical protein
MPEMSVMAPTTSYCLAPSGASSTCWYVSGCSLCSLGFEVSGGAWTLLSLWFDLMYAQKRRYGMTVAFVRAVDGDLCGEVRSVWDVPPRELKTSHAVRTRRH